MERKPPQKPKASKPLTYPFELTTCARCGAAVAGVLEIVLGFSRVMYECPHCGRSSPGKVQE